MGVSCRATVYSIDITTNMTGKCDINDFAMQYTVGQDGQEKVATTGTQRESTSKQGTLDRSFTHNQKDGKVNSKYPHGIESLLIDRQ